MRRIARRIPAHKEQPFDSSRKSYMSSAWEVAGIACLSVTEPTAKRVERKLFAGCGIGGAFYREQVWRGPNGT
jgi:hypothetical protein